MIFINDVRYIKIWDVNQYEKFIKLQASTSDKKQDGSYENSGWYINLVGKAFEQGRHLKKGDTITINKGKITNVYNKDKKQSYLNVTAFDIEVQGQQNQQQKPAPQEDFGGFHSIDPDEDMCPF